MPEIRVGLLAYGAIGHEHNQAVQATPGLTLTAVCDTNPERIDAARELAPDLTGFTDADANAGDGQLPEVLRKTAHRSHGTPDGDGPGGAGRQRLAVKRRWRLIFLALHVLVRP